KAAGGLPSWEAACIEWFILEPLSRVLATLIVTFLPVPASARSASPTPASVVAVRATTPVHIDGKLDDEVWRRAPVTSGFRQPAPDEGRPARAQTDLQTAFDDDALYVSARLHDREPLRIVRRLSRRDDQTDSDQFVLFLDPHHDHLTGVVFGVTAANVQ